MFEKYETGPKTDKPAEDKPAADKPAEEPAQESGLGALFGAEGVAILHFAS